MASMEVMLGRPRMTWDPAALDDEAAAPEAAELEAPETELPMALETDDREPEAEAEPVADAEPALDETPDGRDIEVEATPPTATVDPPERVDGAAETKKLAVLTPLEMVE
jgi:hypothetical protein